MQAPPVPHHTTPVPHHTTATPSLCLLLTLLPPLDSRTNSFEGPALRSPDGNGRNCPALTQPWFAYAFPAIQHHKTVLHARRSILYSFSQMTATDIPDATPDSVDLCDMTPLHFACLHNSVNCALLLLQEKACINAIGSCRVSSFYCGQNVRVLLL